MCLTAQRRSEFAVSVADATGKASIGDAGNDADIRQLNTNIISNNIEYNYVGLTGDLLDGCSSLR